MDEQTDGMPRAPETAVHILRSLEGHWEGQSTTWMEPGTPAQTAPTRGTIRALGESSQMVYAYQSELGGAAFEGVMLFSFNVFSGQFEAAWIDSFHMPSNIMLSTGPGIENGFSVLGSYLFFPDQPAWGWRTQVEMPAPDRLTITAYNVTPDGQEFQAIETLLRRGAA